MIDAPVRVKDALREGNTRKNWRFVVYKEDGTTVDFTIGNNHLVSESVMIDERMCSDKEIKFGLCEGTILEFQCFDVPNITGRRLQAFIDTEYVDENGNTASFPVTLGWFDVDESSRQASTGILKITCINKLKSDYMNNKANDMLVEFAEQGVEGRTDEVSIADMLNGLLGDYSVEPDYEKFHGQYATGTQWRNFTVIRTSNTPRRYLAGIGFRKISDDEYVCVDGYYYAHPENNLQGAYYWLYVAFGDGAPTIVNPGDKGGQYESGGTYRVEVNANLVKEKLLKAWEDSITREFQQEPERYPDCTIDNTYVRLFDPQRRVYTSDYLPLKDLPLYYTAIGTDWTMQWGNINLTQEYEDGEMCRSNYIYNPVASKPVLTSWVYGMFWELWAFDNTSVEQKNLVDYMLTQAEDFVQDYIEDIWDDEALYFYAKRIDTTISETVFTVDDVKELPDVTLRELQSAVFEVSAQFGRMDRETDLFKGMELNGSRLLPAEDLYPANDLYPNSLSERANRAMYEKLWADEGNVRTFRYLIITFKTTEEKDGQITEVEKTLQRTVHEHGTDNYNMSDNWLFKNLIWTEEQVGEYADAMVQKMLNISWFPFEMWCAGLPYIESGDELEINLGDKAYTTYVLRRKLKGLQDLHDEMINGTLDIF